ncbi:MAG: hypothetical protein GXO85_16390 [Chlorobi bacterium]|nr:hypothetical protein [Chlorobiota bacterium]
MKLYLSITIIVMLGLLTGCASSSAINDFFGIEMPPSEVNYFKIIGYTESSGISYQSTKNMNPDINAWAGLEGTNIRIKITNNTDEPLGINYNSDQYLLVNKDGKEFILNKGDRVDYNNLNPIEPNSSIELVLELPKDYWSRVGVKQNPDYMKDFTREQNTLTFEKEKIKDIQIKFGYTKTIILKPVTETKK